MAIQEAGRDDVVRVLSKRSRPTFVKKVGRNAQIEILRGIFAVRNQTI